VYKFIILLFVALNFKSYSELFILVAFENEKYICTYRFSQPSNHLDSTNKIILSFNPFNLNANANADADEKTKQIKGVSQNFYILYNKENNIENLENIINAIDNNEIYKNLNSEESYAIRMFEFILISFMLNTEGTLDIPFFSMHRKITQRELKQLSILANSSTENEILEMPGNHPSLLLSLIFNMRKYSYAKTLKLLCKKNKRITLCKTRYSIDKSDTEYWKQYLNQNPNYEEETTKENNRYIDSIKTRLTYLLNVEKLKIYSNINEDASTINNSEDDSNSNINEYASKITKKENSSNSNEDGNKISKKENSSTRNEDDSKISKKENGSNSNTTQIQQVSNKNHKTSNQLIVFLTKIAKFFQTLWIKFKNFFFKFFSKAIIMN